MAAAREFFESARNLHLDSYVTLKSPGGKEGRVRRVTAEYILSEMPVKKVLENLAYYHDNMPDLLQDEEGATKPKKVSTYLPFRGMQGLMEFFFTYGEASGLRAVIVVVEGGSGLSKHGLYFGFINSLWVGIQSASFFFLISDLGIPLGVGSSTFFSQ